MANQSKALPAPELKAHIIDRPKLIFSKLQIRTAMGKTPAAPMSTASQLTPKIFQPIPKRTPQAAAEPLAHILHSQQDIVAHLRLPKHEWFSTKLSQVNHTAHDSKIESG
jgi:hypothetical protein